MAENNEQPLEGAQPTQPQHPTPAPTTEPTPAQQQPAPQPQQPIIESASATTSRDNHAGPAPYVIVAAVLAVLVALALALANFIGAIGEAISDDYYDSYSYDGLDYDDFLDDLDPQLGEGHDLTADNVFDEELTCTDYTVNDYVFATDYSGSQQVVATYVKALAKADADATSALSGHLRVAAAATDDATRADELAQAATLCQDTTKTIETITLPGEDEITGEAVADILDDLTGGRDATLTRWEKLAQLVEILRSPEGHTSDELADLDNDAGDVTDPAIDLTRALSDSAAHK